MTRLAGCSGRFARARRSDSLLTLIDHTLLIFGQDRRNPGIELGLDRVQRLRLGVGQLELLTNQHRQVIAHGNFAQVDIVGVVNHFLLFGFEDFIQFHIQLFINLVELLALLVFHPEKIAGPLGENLKRFRG